MVTEQFLREQGYTHVRLMNNGEWIGCIKLLYTVALYVGLGEWGYRTRYCYENIGEIMQALLEYEGEGDPPGNWIKEKGEGGERLGPGARGDII